LFSLARLCIGGVLLPSVPSVASVDDPPFPFLFFKAPRDYSSLLTKTGVFLKSAIKSNFMIVFVGMLGVSFSKPPCM